MLHTPPSAWSREGRCASATEVTGQTKHRRDEMGHDAGGAAEGSEHARPAPVTEPGGHREDDSGPRDEDDNE